MAMQKQLGPRKAGRKVPRPEPVLLIARFCWCLPGYINLQQIQWHDICDLIKEAGSGSPALLNCPELTPPSTTAHLICLMLQFGGNLVIT